MLEALQWLLSVLALCIGVAVLAYIVFRIYFWQKDRYLKRQLRLVEKGDNDGLER
jgi:hypothetical protein